MIRLSSIQNCTHPRLFCCAHQIHPSSWASCSSAVNQNSTIPPGFLNATSGKRMLFQIRGLRQKVSSDRKEKDKAEEEESTQSSSASAADLEKERRLFSIKQDQRHPKSGTYEPFRPRVPEKREKSEIVWDIVFGLMFWAEIFILLYIFHIFDEKKEALKQLLNLHKAIFEQPAIGFDQFVHDYLAAGAVEEIAYYPVENKALALLNNGKESPEPKGVHIALSKAFRVHPEFFTNRIRAAEEELGIDKNKCIPITIYDTSTIANLLRKWEI